MTKIICCIILGLFTITAACADPHRYRLEAAKSSVGFTYRFEGNLIKGTMPVASADVVLDFDRLAASTVRINLNAGNARAGFIFATEAMRGKSVLDAVNHPQIRFVSTGISRTPKGAKVDGMNSIRGVTKPISMAASFYRQKGSPPKTLSHLTILLTGSVSRSAFGAAGYPKMVGDRIDLRIIANIQRGK